MVTLSRSFHGGLTPGVMADQRKALADTTELTDRVYYVQGQIIVFFRIHFSSSQ